MSSSALRKPIVRGALALAAIAALSYGALVGLRASVLESAIDESFDCENPRAQRRFAGAVIARFPRDHATGSANCIYRAEPFDPVAESYHVRFRSGYEPEAIIAAFASFCRREGLAPGELGAVSECARPGTSVVLHVEGEPGSIAISLLEMRGSLARGP